MKTVLGLALLCFCTSMVTGQILGGGLLSGILAIGALGALTGGLTSGRGRSSGRSYFVADTNYGSGYGTNNGYYGYQQPLSYFGTPYYVQNNNYGYEY